MKILLIIIIAIAGYQWYSDRQQTQGRASGETHDQLIMYSLTTCGYCKKKGRELRAAGIPYTEYFIDKDRRRRDELNQKLQAAGYPPRSYGTPIFDAYGQMLPNNPSVSKIVSYRDAGA